jgi:hypothetical protein
MALGTADYTVRVATNHMAIPGTGPESAWQDVVAAEQLRRNAPSIPTAEPTSCAPAGPELRI